MEDKLLSARNAKGRLTKEEIEHILSLDLKALEEMEKSSKVEKSLKSEYTFEDYFNLFIRLGHDQENATILATKHYNKCKKNNI